MSSNISYNQLGVKMADLNTEPHIIIDDNRDIAIPPALKDIAVVHDHRIETVTIECPRYWDNNDLSTLSLELRYKRGDNKVGCIKITPKEVQEKKILLDWILTDAVTSVAGSVQFLIVALKLDGEEITQQWSSHLSDSMMVTTGLECEHIPDVNPDGSWEQVLLDIENLKANKLGKIEASALYIPQQLSDFDDYNFISSKTVVFNKTGWADSDGTFITEDYYLQENTPSSISNTTMMRDGQGATEIETPEFNKDTYAVNKGYLKRHYVPQVMDYPTDIDKSGMVYGMETPNSTPTGKPVFISVSAGCKPNALIRRDNKADIWALPTALTDRSVLCKQSADKLYAPIESSKLYAHNIKFGKHYNEGRDNSSFGANLTIYSDKLESYTKYDIEIFIFYFLPSAVLYGVALADAPDYAMLQDRIYCFEDESGNKTIKIGYYDCNSPSTMQPSLPGEYSFMTFNDTEFTNNLYIEDRVTQVSGPVNK